jgi:hypothetical protein
VAFAVGVVALVVAPISATWAQTTSPSPGVSAQSQGWWGELGLGGVPSVPSNPLAGLAPTPAPPAPDVPQGSVPVSMLAGQVNRVGAIGITMDGGVGAHVDKLILHLKESTAPLAEQGTGAAVRACPITDFLVPEDNGQAANTPAEDCDVAHADGVRGDDGTWTFDLTSIGQAWASGAVSVNGFRLDPVGTAPATFQVAFTGYKDATFEAAVVPGTSDGGAFGSADSSGALGSGAFATSGGGELSDVRSTGAPPAATPTPSSAANRSTVPVVAMKIASGFTDSLLAIVLLVVGLGALGLAVAWSMGPNAAADSSRRRGRVSRALGQRVGAGGAHA